MKLIILSSAKELLDEAAQINQLFDNGLELFHLRKPEWDIDEIRELLFGINPDYLNRIVVHHSHELAIEFQLKGIHIREQGKRALGEKLKSYVRGFRDRGFTISGSFHSREDIVNNKVKYDYVFLSPVFDSISKKDYQGKGFDVNDLTGNIFALGGVNENNIDNADQLGYNGVAAIGAVWNAEDPLSGFLALKKATSQLGFKK